MRAREKKKDGGIARLTKRKVCVREIVRGREDKSLKIDLFHLKKGHWLL